MHLKITIYNWRMGDCISIPILLTLIASAAVSLCDAEGYLFVDYNLSEAIEGSF